MGKENRNYKDTMFRLVFKDKTNLLSLYNALNGTSYDNPDDLEITTLENAVYMNMKNDVSFVLDNTLSLYEHQSTLNPNMPLRDLFYVAKQLQSRVRDCDLYGSRPVKIPAPVFVEFYNGTDETEDVWNLRLSELFLKQEGEPNLELKVACYNVRAGRNRELLEACHILGEYAVYVERVRSYSREMSLEGAVERAITECISEGILADFLRKNRAEAMEVCLFEYDEEKHLANERQIAYEEGQKAGMEQGVQQGIEQGIEQGIAQGIKQGVQQGMEQGVKQGMEQGVKQGIAQGVKQGIEQGSERTLLEQISKKLAKGKPVPVIADELEQDEETIAELMRTHHMQEK